jgi:NmrA-like family protein
MSKIITVIGATGIQGGSVVRALLDNPDYSIRAITRNAKSEAAGSLADRGVEVVEADINNVESLRAAFAGTYAIFAVTNFFETLPTLGVEKSMEIETCLGINIADAAAATESLVHFVWSTLPNSRKNTKGNIVVPYYESKNRVDDHIKANPALLSKTTFLWVAWYPSNMKYPWFKPVEVHTVDGSKSYIQMLGVPSSVKLPLLGDEKTNVGLFVKATLDHPERTLPAKIVAGLDEQQSFGEMMQTYGTAQGIKVRSVQIPKSDYLQLWPVWAEVIDISNEYFKLMDGKAFSSVGEDVLFKEDLGVEGLVGTAEAFAAEKLFD